MKVVCPECSSDFDVPQEALGERGKRVRCAQCKHIWFQEPVVEEVAFGGFRRFDESLDIEPIPPSVHPDVSDDDDDDEDDTEKGPSFMATINFAYLGRMIAGFVLGFVIVGGLLMGGAKAGMAPAAFAPFYKVFGMESAAHEPLEIKDVKVEATASGDEKMTAVSGWIVNNSEGDVAIPVLDITPIDVNGESAEGVHIKPEQENLKPKEGLEFKAELQGAPPEGGNIRIRFVR